MNLFCKMELLRCYRFNGSYQLLKKDPITKIKTKTLKQLKLLKDNEFSDNKLYYNPSYQESSSKY